MKFPIKPICEKKFIRKDGTSIVFLQYCFSRKQRTLLNTSIAIPPVYWNPKQGIVTPGLPEEFGNAGELNVQIQKMIRVAEDLVIFAEKNRLEDVGTFVKNSFHPHFK